MQFHLNGYRSGDPKRLRAAADAMQPSEAVADEVDVLIAGCGRDIAGRPGSEPDGASGCGGKSGHRRHARGDGAFRRHDR